MTTYQIIGLLYAGVGIAALLALLFEWLKQKSFDLKFLPISRPLILFCRILIGLLFLYSGYVKANDYIGFGYKLEEYFLVFGAAWPFLKGFFDIFVPFAAPMAWFISVFEVALAFAIMLGWRMNLTAWLALLMMLFFTFLTGWSHVTGSVTDCGCFGDALKIKPWESFVKDIILTGMLLPIFLTRKYTFPFPSAKVANWVVGGIFVITGIYSYYCHEHLPIVDYRAYKLGVDLKTCTTVPGPEGYPKCKDWDPIFYAGAEFDMFSGRTLMIVVENFAKAEAEALAEMMALIKSLEGSNIQVAVNTSSLSRDIKAFQADYDSGDLSIVAQDATVLKTIIRSHPGYVLLQDGIVLNKWHYNDIPSKADLQ
ncbi:MAG: DoxX family protein [Bacteroidota bacterium]